MGIVDGVKDIPGLDLYSSELKDIGVIVNSQDESQMVLHDILSLIDRGIISKKTYSYILITESITEVSSIRDPKQERDAIRAAMIDLAPFTTPEPVRDKKIADRICGMVQDIENKAGNLEDGELGGCWLWLIDNFHEVTRALLYQGKIVVNNDGKYLVELTDYDARRSLRQREEMTKELATLVYNEFGLTAGYFSVLGSQDYNEVPFYNDDHLDNHVFYNWANFGL